MTDQPTPPPGPGSIGGPQVDQYPDHDPRCQVRYRGAAEPLCNCSDLRRERLLCEPKPDQPRPTAEERAAARQAQHDERRARLAALDLDGPFLLGNIELSSFVFGGGVRSEFAVCLRCGCPVILGDPEERPDRTPIERGVRIHAEWHDRIEATR